MIRLSSAQLWVHDQDEALAFYTGPLGWEVRSDVSVPEWSFRWLVVGPPDQPEVGVVLMGYAMAPWDDDMKALIGEVTAKGGGTTLFLETEDCQASYEALLARGVEFTEVPSERPYGIDCGFRDPSGNNLRLTQVLQWDITRGS
ncbi:MAG: VOC family protein [Acidimicrobiales bacterium]|nr:VOC family protein [Acidimicrobiales bacterium]HRW37219.1 VOC family protein [Aquihabitans sp.]